MRNIKIYLLGLLASTLLLGCEDDNDDSSDCKGTTLSTASSGYDNQVKSTVEYYNNSGFLKRVETSFFDSQNDYYETYKYDSDNRIIEYFRSYEGYLKYYYNEDNIVKRESYDLSMNLTGYFGFEYLDNAIVDKKFYSADGMLDSTTNYYYNNGFLDSTVTILSNAINTLYDKMEYKYDSRGNNLERLRYSNHETDKIELFQKYLYSYDENSNLIQYEFRDKNGDLEYGTYFRYEYNDIGNLSKTKIYDADDNQIDSVLVDYEYCDEMKLIKPEL